MGKKILSDFIPRKTRKIIGSKSKLLPLNGSEVFPRLLPHPVSIFGTNIRFLHSISGVLRAAEEMDAIVSFDIGTEAANLEGGYTGITPEIFVQTLFEKMEEVNFSKPFIIHSDHIQLPNSPPVDFLKTKELFDAEYKLGFTSFSVDVTNLPESDFEANVLTLAKPISQWNVGLEVAMDEIEGTKGELSAVEETENKVINLYHNGVKPDLLAIANGGKQGNYKQGESVSMDLNRTLQIFNNLKNRDIGIAQHGGTGIPFPILRQFPKNGINKTSFATLWQNIVHQSLPTELYDKMKYWAEIEGLDIKHSAARYATEISAIPSETIREIEQNTYVAATEIIEVLGGLESASLLKSLL